MSAVGTGLGVYRTRILGVPGAYRWRNVRAIQVARDFPLCNVVALDLIPMQAE
jgi:hypothetical protein